MIPLTIHTDCEVSPLPHDNLIGAGTITDIGLLRNGTARGKASVALVITLDDGSRVIGQTTWALLRTAFHGLAVTPIVAEEVIEP